MSAIAEISAGEQEFALPQVEQMHILVSLGYNVENSNLGSFYHSVTSNLLSRPNWMLKHAGVKSSSSNTSPSSLPVGVIKKKTSPNKSSSNKVSINGRFHVLLAEAQAIGMPYDLLANYRSIYPDALKPITNFNRGFQVICKKMSMLLTLRSYVLNNNLDMTDDIQLPDSYYYSTVKTDENERLMLIAAFEKQQSADIAHNLWVVKPSDACKGHGIMIFNDLNQLLSFFDDVTNKSVAFLIQRYISNPLLLPNGNRKFDIRIWVLYVSTEYTVYYYKNGVCRTASCSYDSNDLSNKYSHLCNHCIAAEHPNYGKYEGEPTNEIFFDNFNKILHAISNGAVDLDMHIIPQITSIICHVFRAGHDMMASGPSDDYDSFMLFGFDFMIDSSYKVWLLEVNSSPAVADALLDNVTRDLIDIAVIGKLSNGEVADQTNNGFIKIMDVNNCA